GRARGYPSALRHPTAPPGVVKGITNAQKRRIIPSPNRGLSPTTLAGDRDLLPRRERGRLRWIVVPVAHVVAPRALHLDLPPRDERAIIHERLLRLLVERQPRRVVQRHVRLRQRRIGGGHVSVAVVIGGRLRPQQRQEVLWLRIVRRPATGRELQC